MRGAGGRLASVNATDVKALDTHAAAPGGRRRLVAPGAGVVVVALVVLFVVVLGDVLGDVLSEEP